MAKTMTEHSRKLRAQTAAERNKRLLSEGKVRAIKVQLDTDLANEFDLILAELGDSRPKAIKALCEFYRQHKA